MKRAIFILAGTCIFLAGPAFAQSFSSGSTGADGAFAPTQNIAVQVPASGVFNYTTVAIPSNVTVTFIRNATNTPVTILTTGDVTVSGAISVDGQSGSLAGLGGIPGPGGFSGGAGGVNSVGLPGDGPGGGGGGPFNNNNGNSSAPCTQSFAGGTSGGGGGAGHLTAGTGVAGFQGTGGPTYGSNTLVPLMGGSGGGGGCGSTTLNGQGGGGGGGAILVASSGNIIFPASGPAGVISASGGSDIGGDFSGGGGSGGGIRLVANSISGIATLNVSGGISSPRRASGGQGGTGFIRVEAFSAAGFNPQGVLVSAALPSSAIPVNPPSLVITSVGGVSAPANPIGSFQASPDIVLPPTTANPVTVAVNASNIPVGTSLNITAVSATGGPTTVSSGPLAGTFASSSTTASVTLTPGVSVFSAQTVVVLTADARPMFMNGERIDKIEVAASYGGAPELTYITHSGRRIRAVR